MFTVKAGTELTPELIEEAIAYNDKDKSRLSNLENYYLGEHIIKYRTKAEAQSNNKVIVNHAKYITDVNVGYLLGNPVTYKASKEFNLDPLLEEYNKQVITDLDREIAKDVSIFGRQYELVYNVDNSPRSKDIDVRNCALVYDDSIEHKIVFGIIYKRAEKRGEFEDILVYDDNFVYNYTQKGRIALNTIDPHYFGEVPIIKYQNNSDEQGDYEQVISLIDAYNTLQSDRVNDKEQLVDALLLIYGMQITPEQKELMKASRMMANLPVDSKVEYLTKQLNELDADTLRRVLEQDIHKISMTPNMSDENFVGNASGVAIRYKLLAFEQNISGKERSFEAGLKSRFRKYNNYLANLKAMPLIETHEVDVIFKRNLPRNDFETSQMVNNLSGLVSKATLLSELSFIDDVKEEIETAENEDVEVGIKPDMNFGTINPTEFPVK
jgi:SPP1 family phage portal protein